MVKIWLLSLLAVAEAATHAVQLSADGELWDFPMDPAKRIMRQEENAYVQQDQAELQLPDTMVRILTNNTDYVHAFLRGLKSEAAAAHTGITLALVGTLLCAMLLFYMVNQPNKDLQVSTWQLLSGNIALFCTVMLFMALKKSWKLMVGDKAAEWVIAGDILAFLKFALLMFSFPFVRSKIKNEKLLAAAKTSGAYLIGFAGSDSFAYILRLEPFSSGAGYYFMGMVLMFAVLAGLMAMAFRLGQPPEEYDPSREVEQIDAAGFQIGFMMSMWVRFLVTGFLPGSKQGARALTTSDLLNLAGALFFSVLIFAGMMWKVRPLADSPERKPVYRRVCRTLTEASAMTMGWLLMYWVQWVFWYSMQSEDGSHNSGKHAALMSQAMASTVLVYMGVVALSFVAKKMGKNMSEFTELNNAWVLQTGFCWEMAIYMGLVDAYTAPISDPSNRRMAAIAWIVLLLALIVPAWFWYILPKAMEKAEGGEGEGKGEGKAEGKEASAADEKADSKKDSIKSAPKKESLKSVPSTGEAPKSEPQEASPAPPEEQQAS